METFEWVPRIEPVGQVTPRVLRAQFGDGYAQTAGDGINPSKQSWPLEFVGLEVLIKPIKAFLDRHAGYKSFEWTPPLGKSSAWLASKGYSLQPMGAGVYRLNVTFEEENLP